LVDTPGCTTQACGIRDRSGEYDSAGAVVLGVSPDEPKALRKFADKYGLAFTLLSDEGGTVAQRYGTWVEKNRGGRTYFGNERSSVLVDPEGNIARVFPNVKPAEHDDQVLAALKELS
jgi:thioredoxin-dependent peroxiredoxin